MELLADFLSLGRGSVITTLGKPRGLGTKQLKSMKEEKERRN